MSLDDTLSAAEADAHELEQLFAELQSEMSGLDEIDARIEAFSKMLDEELKK